MKIHGVSYVGNLGQGEDSEAVLRRVQHGPGVGLPTYLSPYDFTSCCCPWGSTLHRLKLMRFQPSGRPRVLPAWGGVGKP
jgi:hypothetical protein